jgi:hypothetical protein
MDSPKVQHWGIGVNQWEHCADPKDLGRVSEEIAGREVTTHGSCNASEDVVDEEDESDVVGEREGLVSRTVLDHQAEYDRGEDGRDEEDGDWNGEKRVSTSQRCG